MIAQPEKTHHVSDRRLVLASNSADPSTVTDLSSPVIVTGGQFPGALAALRSLDAGGFDPIAVATVRLSYVRFSRSAAQVALAADVSVSASRFVEQVAALCSAHEPTVIIPGTEAELVALVKWRHLLPPTVLGLPSSETLARVSSKLRLNEFALAAGLAVPPTSLVSATDLSQVVPYPAVAKPVHTVEQRGDALVSVSAVPIDSFTELTQLFERLQAPELLVQPRLRGQLHSLAGVMWNGVLQAPIQQVARSIYPEPCGGSAIAQTVEVDPTMVRRLEHMLRLIGWEGIAQMQWIRADDGDYVIDLNPRVYGSLALANAAGSNLAAIWADSLLGRPVHNEPTRSGVTYRNLETFLRTSSGRHIGKPQRHAGKRASSVFAARDPLPVLASVARGARRLRRQITAGASPGRHR